MLQVESQPSRSSISPSSQLSPDVLMPSPQTSEHVEAVVRSPPVHEYPVAGPEQSFLHPTASSLSPSSQVSPATSMPSCHVAVHVDWASTTLVHVQPFST